MGTQNGVHDGHLNFCIQSICKVRGFEDNVQSLIAKYCGVLGGTAGC